VVVETDSRGRSFTVHAPFQQRISPFHNFPGQGKNGANCFSPSFTLFPFSSQVELILMVDMEGDIFRITL
jgi:hypothetical protein